MGDLAIIPAPPGSEAYVELASDPGTARRFRKHVLNLGPLLHPVTGEKLDLDEKFYQQVERNFRDGLVDHVTVPLANDKNQHVEAPERNAGEVYGLHRDGQKIYVDMEIRDPDVAEKIANKTILGASAFLSLDYKDSRTGEKKGGAIIHSALTNRPYVLGLEPYRELVEASASAGEDAVVMTPAPIPVTQASPPLSDGTGEVLVLAQEAPRMTKEELLAALKAEHGVDVEALQAQAGQRSEMSQLTAALTEALRPAAGTVQLTQPADGEVSLSDVVGAVAELAEKNVALSGTVGDLRKDAATREVEGYIGVGRLLPKSRSRAIEMVLSGDREGLDDFLAPEGQPYVKLNHVEGAAPPQGEQKHQEDIDQEILRLTTQPDTEHFFSNGQSRK